MHPLILEPRELNEMLTNDEPRLVIDLSNPETWARAHIEGAVHVTPASLVCGIKPAVGKLPADSTIAALLAAIGYRPEQHIVAYDDEGGGWAGRFLWTLDLIGHKQMSYLNGGIHAWIGEGFPVTSEATVTVPTDVEITVDRSKIATREEIVAHLSDPEQVVWDARSHAEYTGEKVFAARGGHIPGAINLDWLDVMDRQNNLRIRSDIAEVLGSLGIDQDKKIVTHCQTHHRSGLTWLVGHALGYDIRAYDGSWSEWGNDPDLPVETG